MSAAPPPLAYSPSARKTSGCGRAVLILIFGVLLVFVLAKVTKDKDAGETVAEETEVESSSAAPSAGPLLLDVPAIAGKTPEEVDRLLGKADSREETKYGPKHVYRDGLVEIVFIHGKADWISVMPKTMVPFSKEALKRVGLSAGDPTFSSEHAIRWVPCGEYVSAVVLPAGGGKLESVYIKVATE